MSSNEESLLSAPLKTIKGVPMTRTLNLMVHLLTPAPRLKAARVTLNQTDAARRSLGNLERARREIRPPYTFRTKSRLPRVERHAEAASCRP